MLKWVQSGLSVVAGTAEPEYGSSAIHPVTKQEGINEVKPWNSITDEDLKYINPSYTNVETQTFYFYCSKTGYCGLAQIIHSNLMGLNTTAQFTFKCYHKDSPDKFVWTSTKLEEFEPRGTDFYSNNGQVEIKYDSVKGEYTVKSLINPESLVELTFHRDVEGVKFGKDGTTYYGDDMENPWGSIRHIFWPRCSVTGSLQLGDTKREIDGLGMYSFAYQGMKPHHAAASWNFLNYVSPSHSVVMMEFTTPSSYGKTRVNVAILTDTEKVLAGTIDNEVVFKDRVVDEVGWSIPKSIDFKLSGFVAEGKPLHASVSGDLAHLSERIDIMHEIPTFVKNLVSGIAGTRPYIYQFCNKMKLTVDQLNIEEEGLAYNEITFISDV